MPRRRITINEGLLRVRRPRRVVNTLAHEYRHIGQHVHEPQTRLEKRAHSRIRKYHNTESVTRLTNKIAAPLDWSLARWKRWPLVPFTVIWSTGIACVASPWMVAVLCRYSFQAAEVDAELFGWRLRRPGRLGRKPATGT
jgi:hypothetical protein